MCWTRLLCLWILKGSFHFDGWFQGMLAFISTPYFAFRESMYQRLGFLVTKELKTQSRDDNDSLRDCKGMNKDFYGMTMITSLTACVRGGTEPVTSIPWPSGGEKL
ncbi:hypothetical protein BDZ97DRAFT_2055651 [Flammula alnicola]|nr:hypothetical protein BDZ97DRAFT_2055651 [Flammula alnicola]